MLAVSKMHILEAFKTSKCTDQQALKERIKTSLQEYYIRGGFTSEGQTQYISEMLAMLVKDISTYFQHLHVGEVYLAIVYGANGVFGELQRPCVNAFISYIKSYIALNERKAVIKEIEDERQRLMLPQVSEATKAEVDAKLRQSYLDNLANVRAGRNIVDVGGLLFAKLKEIGHVSLTDEHINEAVDECRARVRQRINEAFNRELLNRHNNGENVFLPQAEKIALKQYFHNKLKEKN